MNPGCKFESRYKPVSSNRPDRPGYKQIQIRMQAMAGRCLFLGAGHAMSPDGADFIAQQLHVAGLSEPQEDAQRY